MEWLSEIGLALLRIFLQPYVYIFLALVWLSGYIRIKKDRQSFQVKVFPYFKETTGTWSVAIISGIIISLLSVAAGFILPLYVVIFIGLLLFVSFLINSFGWLSPGYILPFAALTIFFVNEYGENYLSEFLLSAFEQVDLSLLAILMSLLLFSEAWLIRRGKGIDSFPELKKSKRGKYVGQHRLKKITIIPFFVLLPAGLLEPIMPWWPLLEVGGESFGLILIPYVLGFEYKIKSMLTSAASKQLAAQHFRLAFLVLAAGVTGYFYPISTLIAFILAFLGKEFIHFLFKLRDERAPMYFQPGSKGVQVLGVLPNSPAVDLGLLPGERIISVNDLTVDSEEEFYHAVSKSRASCKLTVEDLNGELRFARRALYEGEHHELGVLFIKDGSFYHRLENFYEEEQVTDVPDK
ncbi:hypothetical protein GGQ92_001094 [Gracilibacillus halotolerans]|uniref:PDZ domain-containing protein n=1 Tax=Gracilibacillus halotolerans TaxID=74386 RepID=A0A841RL14_9BACI|nr:PDZ domain-containing protein [Gracilibacillus halotolerans]MBB6512313.1 hypothetical protein [Gracilibacillus halotolerans]